MNTIHNGKIVPQVHNIFSVPIFVTHLKGITDKLKIKDLLERELVENRKEEVKPWDIEQTNPNLHTKEEFEGFCRVIKKLVSGISENIMEFDGSYSAEITSMWGNRQPYSAHFRRHTHHNNLFSGVFYPDENKEFPPINFYRPLYSDFAPTVSKNNRYNSGMSRMPTQKDHLIIFPSWLEHDIPSNPSKQDRLSISFNVMMRGKYQEDKTNQSTIF